ncbi:MAG: hypothetical protein ACE5GO_08440 [Anaerolineales bacterium]
MRTPAGRECPYFYGDYYRGRHREECRLLEYSAPEQRWTPDLCSTCPVPDVTLANSCEHQRLTAQIKRPLFLFKRRIVIEAHCTKHLCDVDDPHIGCGQCHPNIQFIIGENSDPDPAA